MIDYHLHSSRCGHAVGTLKQYLAEAERKGLREIGFADHFPLGLLHYRPRNKVTMESEELAVYIEEVEQLKLQSPAVLVKLGIEIDYLPGSEELVGRLLEQYPFDYVIGSIHFMNDWDFTHPDYADSYRDKDLDHLYEQYFTLLWQLCRTGLFDLVGHIDVIKKFGYRPQRDLTAYWNETASILKTNNLCFELNTAGRDAPVADFYPDYGLLKACQAAQVAVTTGSDAHCPEQVGRYFSEAYALLKQAGYQHVVSFSARQMSRQAIS